MNAALRDRMAIEQDERIAAVVQRERSRLLDFIRRRVSDPVDAEDVLQDVFYRLVEANRLLMPIDHITGWLFQVARNRIVDLFRKKKPDDDRFLDQLLAPAGDGPEAEYARHVLIEQLGAALDELPGEQREVFIAHEIDGRSFKEIAAESGVNVNTLLSRKHYAVLHLRERLQDLYDDLNRSET